MHPEHPGSTANAVVDVSGLWFCPQCVDIHLTPRCSFPEGRTRGDLSRLESGVRLCACCCRTAVAGGSRFSSFFCSECGARVVEINRSMGRLVVPLCRDPDANCALFPTPHDDCTPFPGIGRHTRFFGAQLELLEDTSHYRTTYLFRSLRFPDDESVLLEAYLRGVETLRADVFQPAAALHELMSAFCEYLLDIPSESPALAACVEEHGIDFAHFFPAADARELLEKGPAFVRGVASWWSWKVIEEVLPLPTCVYPAEPGVLARRGHTVLALQKAAVRHLVRVHGPVKRPSAPQVGPCSPCVALVDSGVCRPDAFPKACPRTARFVVGLEGPPAAPEDLLSAYHLGVDRRHLWWILWADAGEGAPPALAAWCPRGGLTPVQAAFLLLEASLTRDRERYGTDCRRPRVAIDGILDEDLADVLLDRIWPTE